MRLASAPSNGPVSIPGYSNTEDQVANYLMGDFNNAGMTPAGAAAVIGNWVQESSLDYQDNSSSGLGIAQWMGGRATAEENYAAQHRLAPLSLQAEAGYALTEMHADPTLWGILTSTNNPSQAALAVSNLYERPIGTAYDAHAYTPNPNPIANVANRQTQASKLFQAFNGAVQGAQTPPKAAGGSSTGGSSGGNSDILGTLGGLFNDATSAPGAVAGDIASIGSSLNPASAITGIWTSLLSDAKYAALFLLVIAVGGFLIVKGISANGAKLPQLPTIIPIPE